MSLRERRRLIGVDAARGVALLGMMAVHVLPSVADDGSITESYLIAGGRSAALFALLAGVGLALASGAEEPPHGRTWTAAALSTAVRAAVIGVVGLLVGVFDSGVAVILVYYALLFLVAIPLLPLRAPILAGLAIVAAFVVPVLSFAIRPDLPPPTLDNPTASLLVEDPIALLSELLLTGYYPVLAWTTYLCAGLAVGRSRLRAPRAGWWLLGGGVALAAASSAVSALLLGPLGGRAAIERTLPFTNPVELQQKLELSFYGNTPTDTWWWLAVDAPHSSTPFDMLHTTGTSLAILGAAFLLARVVPALLVPLAAAGSMTLSLYSAHVLFLASGIAPEDETSSYLLQVVLVLLIGSAWRAMFARGPLEALIAQLAQEVRRSVLGAPQPQRGLPTDRS